MNNHHYSFQLILSPVLYISKQGTKRVAENRTVYFPPVLVVPLLQYCEGHLALLPLHNNSIPSSTLIPPTYCLYYSQSHTICKCVGRRDKSRGGVGQKASDCTKHARPPYTSSHHNTHPQTTIAAIFKTVLH